MQSEVAFVMELFGSLKKDLQAADANCFIRAFQGSSTLVGRKRTCHHFDLFEKVSTH